MQDGGAGPAYEETQGDAGENGVHVDRYIGTKLRYILVLLRSLGRPNTHCTLLSYLVLLIYKI